MKVIEKVCTSETVCVDIGANEGTILQLFTSYCPNAVHFAFEPLPALYFALKRKYSSAVKIHKVALANAGGNATFTHVTTNPALSSLKRVALGYAEKEETINVKTGRLDDFIGAEKIGIIKLAAAGGEYDALLGAKRVIEHSKPHILFKFNKACAGAFGVTPEQMHKLLEEYGYTINVLPRFLTNLPAIPFLAFKSHFIAQDEELYIAVPS
ncbi:MAG: methyltransferase FkbM family [Segetibacter sp.]|nr:methyltransferase FkbM family [Segetibacter sp.]